MKTLTAFICLFCLSSATWLFASSSAAQDSDEPQVSELDWLAGRWSGVTDGVLFEEHWMEPRGGMLLGMHRDVRVEGDRAVSFEYMRIVTDAEGMRFIAQPGGRPPTAFALEDIAPGRVVFANPEHDFPQRISYELEENGKVLHARAEGSGKTLEWRWRRGP